MCQSGHYVRDPFTFRQIMLSQSLRRQSRPLARIVRDFILLKHPAIALAVGGAIFLGIITMTQTNTTFDHQQLPRTQQSRE